jgi:hypothetical protein
MGRPTLAAFLLLRLGWVSAIAVASLAVRLSFPQVLTVDTRTGTITNGKTTTETVDRRYQQIAPTSVPLSKEPLDPKTRLALIRALASEQGFAMRPFPRGHKGLTLIANGKMEPYGEAYLEMATAEGVSAKPGARVVLTGIKIDRNHIVFDLDGGPEPKHRILRHVQIGVGPMMNPVVQDNEQEPTGARLTLVFEKTVPELTGVELKALLAPLISFDVKTPVQAFTDTLPAKLKEAILNHHVLVGMSTEMVLFAKGQPLTKMHEMEGQDPFDEWIYGKPPQDVEFVRLNGNRVIRLEIAKVGETPVVYSKDEVEGLMRTDGSPLFSPSEAKVHYSKSGDVERDSDTQAPAAPPTLRNPGEKLPSDDPQNNQHTGVMRPVQFPKPKPADTPAAEPAPPQASQPGSPPATPAANPPGSPPATQPARQPGANPDEEPAAPAPPAQPVDASPPTPVQPQAPQ